MGLLAIYDLLHDEILPAIAAVQTASKLDALKTTAETKMEAVRAATVAGGCKWRERPDV